MLSTRTRQIVVLRRIVEIRQASDGLTFFDLSFEDIMRIPISRLFYGCAMMM